MRAIELWFRFDDYLESAGVDEFDNPLGPPILRVSIREFEVEKRTAKGVWLRACMFRRFCLSGARKRFAAPTLESALESFLARKRKQMRIYERRLRYAEQASIAAVEEADVLHRKLGRKILNDWISQ